MSERSLKNGGVEVKERGKKESAVVSLDSIVSYIGAFFGERGE
jgi:hypothetical protein